MIAASGRVRAPMMVGASVLAIALSAPAHAQDVTPPNQQSTAAAPAVSPAATPASPNAVVNEAPAGVTEVVVTAQRRAENLQRSSLSLDVVGSEELTRAAVTDPRELNRVVPSVQIGQSGSFTQVFVRGIGTSSANQFGDPSVTFNEDGVVIDRPNMVGPIFYDVARVEVLRGPQGTLYGRNATGGAINLITRAPGRDLGGYLSAQYGSYSNYVLSGALNVPLSSDFAIRASGQVQGRHSYLKGGYPTGSGYRDTRSQAGRLQALWTPTPDITVRLIGEASHDTGPGDNFVLIAPNEPNSDPWLGAANPYANALITAGNPLQILIRSDDDQLRRKLWNVTGQIDWNLNFATLTILPAHRHMTLHSISYDGGIKLRYDERSNQDSVEVRLAHSTGALKWLVGGYYFDNGRNVYNMIDSNPLSQRALQVFPNIGSKSYAAFADATFSLTDRIRLLGGIRYTSELKTVQGVRTDLDANPTNNFVLNNRRRFNEVTWRAGAEIDVAPASMAYLTVSRGFKSGGFYTAVSPGNEFNPEHLTAFTAGIRNRFLDNRLQLNVEGFYWKYKDNQQSAIGFDGFGNIAFVTRNAGNARLFGVSTDIVARVTPADTLQLAAEYNNTKFNDFRYVVPSFFNPLTTGCAVGPVTGSRRTVDCSGFPLPRAPKFTARAGYDHRFTLGNGGNLVAAASGQYVSSKYLSIDYLAVGKAGATFTGDLDLTYTAPHDRYSLAVFVHNVTNEVVYTGGGEHQQIAGLFYGNINPPRTFGVRGQINF